VPTRRLYNTFEVMPFYEATMENCPKEPFTTYIDGLWLEGAEWDATNKLLIEPITSNIFEKFPAIKVRSLDKEIDDDLKFDQLTVFEDNP